MKILTFTTLFPNREEPNKAVFIKSRMSAVNRFCNADVRVVSPVPYFPSIPFGGRWGMQAKIPHFETWEGMDVFHPRYLVSPKVGMTLYGYSMFFGSLQTVKKIFIDWPFDLIDAHYVYPDGLAATLLGRYFNRPVIVSARGTDINLYPQFRLVRPLVKKVLRDADHLISVCGSLRDIMTKYGAEYSKITIIPNGIDPLNFDMVEQSYARKRLNIELDEKILLTVGSLIERKGMHLLIEALALLKERSSLDFTTLIVGHGPERERLQLQINENSLQPFVRLVGDIPNADLGSWYNAADLFFLGSSREGWPNVVSEALACGTPVIATPVNGITEIITSPEYGITALRDPVSFADALQVGFSRKWNRKLIHNYGRSRTWEVVAQEVYKLFFSLCPDCD